MWLKSSIGHSVGLCPVFFLVSGLSCHLVNFPSCPGVFSLECDCLPCTWLFSPVSNHLHRDSVFKPCVSLIPCRFVSHFCLVCHVVLVPLSPKAFGYLCLNKVCFWKSALESFLYPVPGLLDHVTIFIHCFSFESSQGMKVGKYQVGGPSFGRWGGRDMAFDLLKT